MGATKRGEPRRWLEQHAAEITDDCRLWPFSIGSHGYGQIRWDGTTRLATHIALQLDGRPRPSRELEVLHACDVRACVNPRHLRWGTSAQNSAEMVERGRGVQPCLSGSDHPQARLNEEQVAEIRAAYATGDATQYELAADFDVSQVTVGRIVRREIWKDAA